jgi:hypothetical protein
MIEPNCLLEISIQIFIFSGFYTTADEPKRSGRHVKNICIMTQRQLE